VLQTVWVLTYIHRDVIGPKSTEFGEITATALFKVIESRSPCKNIIATFAKLKPLLGFTITHIHSKFCDFVIGGFWPRNEVRSLLYRNVCSSICLSVSLVIHDWTI